MVDFPNPVFSARRRRLLEHVPATPIDDGAEAFAETVADAILSSPEATRPGAVGGAFEEAFDALLERYYAAFAERLTTQEGFDDYMRLAESRRERVRGMPIAESPLLFARANVPAGARAMRRDGTVQEVSNDA